MKQNLEAHGARVAHASKEACTERTSPSVTPQDPTVINVAKPGIHNSCHIIKQNQIIPSLPITSHKLPAGQNNHYVIIEGIFSDMITSQS